MWSNVNEGEAFDQQRNKNYPKGHDMAHLVRNGLLRVVIEIYAVFRSFVS